ncbi:hypothetical protein [Morganella phage Mecenats66]|nr:hypothetical protein [Morganella phage Mecenats66]
MSEDSGRLPATTDIIFTYEGHEYRFARRNMRDEMSIKTKVSALLGSLESSWLGLQRDVLGYAVVHTLFVSSTNQDFNPDFMEIDPFDEIAIEHYQGVADELIKSESRFRKTKNPAGQTESKTAAGDVQPVVQDKVQPDNN